MSIGKIMILSGMNPIDLLNLKENEKISAFIPIDKFDEQHYLVLATKLGTIKKIDEVFGLGLLKKEKIEIPAEVRELTEEREKARKAKDWKKSDKLREKVKKLGYWINDTPEGPQIRKF